MRKLILALFRESAEDVLKRYFNTVSQSWLSGQQRFSREEVVDIIRCAQFNQSLPLSKEEVEAIWDEGVKSCFENASYDRDEQILEFDWAKIKSDKDTYLSSFIPKKS